MSLGVEERLRALASPERLRILSLARAESVSAAEVARRFGIAHASASYHLRQLLAAEFIEVAEERRIRGGTETRYRLRADAFHNLGDSTALVEATMLSEITRRLPLRRSDTVAFLSDGEGWVEPEVWTATLERVRSAIATLAASTQPHSTPGVIHVSVSALLFEIGDDS